MPDKDNMLVSYAFLFVLCLFIVSILAKNLKNNDMSINYTTEEDVNKTEIIYDKDVDKGEPADETPTVKKLLQSALLPIGNTLYVYGGGWNEDDTGAGEEALTYWVSPRWYEFFKENDAEYNFEDTMYQMHDGLDCTGYVGFVVYQTFGNAYSDSGYVYPSKDMVIKYSSLFDSTFIDRASVSRYYPGDIMGTDGHVFIVIGQCSDGSLLLVHASPPVVSICGTKTHDGNADSEAVRLAKQYMAEYFPESYARYDSYIRDTDFLTDYDQMHWNRNILPDPDGYDDMTPEEILKDLFGE